jgi:hypothetical protein
MTDEKINELLNALADATEEPAPPTLNETIEHQIPQMLTAHRGGWDTINIIIDLRVSRLVAAAVIIATMFLLAGLFGSHNGGDDIYQDSKMLISYCLKGENASTTNIISGMSKFCEYLVNRGKEVTYYGETVNPADKDAILLHWKLSDGSYRVIFSDLRIAVATPEELIKLQAKMLQKKSK